jgi:hypothetical protein
VLSRHQSFADEAKKAFRELIMNSGAQLRDEADVLSGRQLCQDALLKKLEEL